MFEKKEKKKKSMCYLHKEPFFSPTQKHTSVHSRGSTCTRARARAHTHTFTHSLAHSHTLRHTYKYTHTRAQDLGSAYSLDSYRSTMCCFCFVLFCFFTLFAYMFFILINIDAFW